MLPVLRVVSFEGILPVSRVVSFLLSFFHAFIFLSFVDAFFRFTYYEGRCIFEGRRVAAGARAKTPQPPAKNWGQKISGSTAAGGGCLQVLMLGVVVAGDLQVQFGKKRKGGEGKPQNSLGSDCCLALAHVLAPEQKLSVQVAHVDRVEIHDLNLSEARQDQDLRRGPRMSS